MTTRRGLHRDRAVREQYPVPGDEQVRQRRTAQPVAWSFVVDQNQEK